jgi:hypothetical protein
MSSTWRKSVTPLIDSDILRYEVGHSGEYWQQEELGDGSWVDVLDDDGQRIKVIRDFQFVGDLFDQKIKEICAEVWATEPPVLYLTNDRRMHKQANKLRKKAGEEELEYQPNFRDAIAEKKEYKGNRKSEKPFHYDNLTAHIFANNEVKVAVGMEADDLLSIDQYARIKELDTIICGRDKDLRITPGLHFGWECGRQMQFGPVVVTELGELTLKGGSKLVGTGLKFFYSQVVTGDAVDNIPGLPRGGPMLAYKSLHDAETEAELFERVAGLYEAKFGDSWRAEMLEQCRLLWMVRELDDEGQPVQYVMYDERN